MKYAGDPLGVANRLIEKGIAAVRADVVKTAHLHILPAYYDQRRATRMLKCAVIKRIGNLAFVTGDDPDFVENLFLLFAEKRFVGVNARIDKMRLGELRLFVPLLSSFGHALTLHQFQIGI